MISRPRLALFTLVSAIGVAIVVSWILLSDETTTVVDAQTTIEDACKDAEEVSSGIITMNGTDTRLGSTHNYTWEVRFSGDNRSWHIKDSGGQAETYFIGNVTYSRETVSPGTWGDWDVSVRNAPAITAVGPTGPTGQVDDTDDSPMTFCGMEGLTGHTYLGQQTLNGAQVGHFSARIDDQYVGQGDSIDLEFWVDDDGQMQQFKLDEMYVDSQGQPEIQIAITGTISNLGEPVTIEAPNVPIPTETPTPVEPPPELFGSP